MHFFLLFTRNVYVRETLRLIVMIVLAIAAGLAVLLALYLSFRKQRFFFLLPHRSRSACRFASQGHLLDGDQRDSSWFERQNLVVMKHRLLTALMLGLYSGVLFGQCSLTELAFTTSAGDWNDEIQWELFFRSKNGDQMLASYRGDASEMSPSKDIFCLEEGWYYFRLFDAWGDGWNGGALTCDPPIPGFSEKVTLKEGHEGYHLFHVRSHRRFRPRD